MAASTRAFMPDEALPPQLTAARAAVAAAAASPAALAATEPAAVSVVIPTYMRHDLAVMAAEAALGQRLDRPFEVVVVDNASTDDTAAAFRALAARTAGRLRYLRLDRNRGRSVSRNAGIAVAAAPVIAFTDSDCLPTPDWLAGGLAALEADPAIGLVQGRTGPPPGQSPPFFSHFIVTERLDGTHCTSNVFYRRRALLDVDGFDPANVDWEDMDLGYRVRRSGWRASFAESAVVHHQVIPVSARAWLGRPLAYRYWPAAVARYPEHRQHLVLGLWVDRSHVLISLAVPALLLATLVNRRWLGLALPYVVAFPTRHGFGGRWPAAKACLHALWDLIAFAALLFGSIRHRTPTL
jgi:GT2 family glycosyltransferase